MAQQKYCSAQIHLLQVKIITTLKSTFGVYRSDYFWLDLLRECRYLKLVWTIQEETFESRRTDCFGRRQRTYVPSLRADISFIPFVAQRKGTI